MTTILPSLLAQSAGGGPLITVGYIAALFAIMYFLLISPQQKQAREHRELMQGLKKGDDVVTQAGIIGKIYAVMDKVVVVEIANGVRVRVLKTAIQGRAAIVDEPAAVRVEEKKEEK